MPKISVVIITFNEERNIERCLKSIIDVADEIVVVDSFSVDKTEELCNKYGVKFIQHPFVGHIEQKNYAITQASYPHILSLDADEELSSTLKKSILEVKENWTHDGYYFNRLTSYCGKWIRHTSWYPARKLRLWDSRKGRWGGTNPHDKFILKKGCNQKFIKGDLLHYSYYSIQDHIQQINRFTDIVARSYYQKGKNASYFNILFHPIWRLFRDYIIKLGFLDGFYGLVISVNSAHETFLKYIKLRNIIRTQDLSQRYKICFVNTTKTWGGGEKWHYDISTRICNSGKDVIFITNKRSELFFRIRRTCLKLYSIRVSNLSFISFFKIKKIVKILQREKVKTIIINLSAD
ncbi:MAG: glycosyltransferase, partial [bacterium]